MDDVDPDQVWQQLKEIALADGIITEEEKLLLENALIDYGRYRELLEMAKADGIIDEKEQIQLFEQRMRIAERAYLIARADYHISDDEAALLKAICTIVMGLKG